MGADLVIAPEAEADLEEAYAWYEFRRVGLGEEFLASVDVSIRSIRRSPKAGRQLHDTFRRALVRRFPYAVFYDYADETVTVYCIMHTARDPEAWRERLS